MRPYGKHKKEKTSVVRCSSVFFLVDQKPMMLAHVLCSERMADGWMARSEGCLPLTLVSRVKR